jgi:hypothetical protein
MRQSRLRSHGHFVKMKHARVEPGQLVEVVLIVEVVLVVIVAVEAELIVTVVAGENALRGVGNDKVACKMGQECDWVLKRPKSNHSGAGVA